MFALISATIHDAFAAPSRIRDAEIEHTLRAFADPILETAGIPRADVNIFILQDPSINAFVAGGKNIFIYTGLLLATDSPDMVIGVIAHETGHIAGGHLARGAEKMQNAKLGALLSYILGAAAGIAGGSGQAGAAVISAGQQALQRNLLAFSRANENAADQAGLSYLDAIDISAEGFLKMLEVLRNQENLRFGQKTNGYTLTHPLSKERIMNIRSHVSQVGHKEASDAFKEMHARMVAKLSGFLDPPEQTFQQYPESDKSIPARLARAVAWYKTPDVDKALVEVDSLIAERPKDPFFYDLKAQILFENSRVKEAVATYEKAIALLPDAPLIRTDLARAQLALEDPALLAKATENLEKATEQDHTNPVSWRLLATAYGKQDKLGLSHLALGEEALLQNDTKIATREADEAMKALPTGSPSRLRAIDVKRLAEEMKKEEEENK